MDDRSRRLQNSDCEALAGLMAAEEAHYRRLLRLAWRQNSYMKRQAADRLQENAAEWARHLPRADAARIARERACDALRAACGAEGRGVAALYPDCPPAGATLLQDGLAILRGTAARLARQNELNRHLAAFCVELAQEESRIFRACVTDDPAGCYGRDARSAQRGAGGVIARQA